MINNGKHATIKYITGYIVEKSLSVDNIFVIVMVFNFFAVPPLYQHRVLFWGVLGALIMRGGMIAIGATLVAEFHWVLYIFGAFLIFTAIRMLLSKEGASDPHDNFLVRLVRKIMPVTSHYHGTHFAVKAGSIASHESETPDGPVLKDDAVEHERKGVWMLTPLALSLVVVETTDLIFAVDSIPAIFAITADPFIVFTSNVFAILGLRSLYFALAGMVNKFRYLKAALSAVLFVVGVKMLIADYLREWLGSNFNFYLLGVVALILTIGVVASLMADKSDKQKDIHSA
jgi:tellurite resistance protein TerC